MEARPIAGSSSSSSFSTRLTTSTNTVRALRVTTQRGYRSEELRRRMARLTKSSALERSKQRFSWRWVPRWNRASRVVTWLDGLELKLSEMV